MDTSILTGIAGRSGSGVTLVANIIAESLRLDNAVVIHEVSCYKDLSNIPYQRRASRNYDHPDPLDHDLPANPVFLVQEARI